MRLPSTQDIFLNVNSLMVTITENNEDHDNDSNDNVSYFSDNASNNN